MYCYNCGSKLEEGTVFCPECGAKQQEEPVVKRNSNHVLVMGIGIAVVLLVCLIGGIVLILGLNQSERKSEQIAQSATESAAENDAAESQSSSNSTSKELVDKDAMDKETVDKEAMDEGTANKKANVDEKESAANSDGKEKTPVITHEYTVVGQMMTWGEAQNYCQSQGGHLATAATEAEYNEILQQATASGLKVLWLGATLNSATGQFVWSTAEPFSYASWAAGEPNNENGVETYLGIMYVNGTWAMYDLPSDVSAYYTSVGFVMEKDIEN